MTQKVFTKGGLIDDPSKVSPDDLSELQRWSHVPVDCPYCLLHDTMDKFATFVQGGKKYPEKLSYVSMKCPECGQGLRQKTLKKVTYMTVDEFAWWFWENVFCWRMMEKVNADVFFNRIKEWNFEDKQDFWDIYRWYKNATDKHAVRQDYNDYLDYTGRIKEQEDEDKFDT